MKIKIPTKCIYCGATEVPLSDEHIVPIASLEIHWPLLTGFSFEVFALPPSHYLFVMKNEPDKIPSGPDGATVLQYSDHPELPPRIEDLFLWHQWVNSRLGITTKVWPFLLPVHDSGQSHGVDNDYALFSQIEKDFWDAQWNFLVNALLQQAIENANAVDTR